MSSPQASGAREAASRNQQMASEAYGLGIPMLNARNAALMPALRVAQAGQLPDYMMRAYDTQRTGLTEGILAKERGAIGAQDARAKGTVAGGNAFSTMNPAQMGAALADALMGSRVSQGMATVNQANTLMQMGMGGAAQTGNQAIQSAGLELQANSMLPNYNPTYANVLGIANAAGTLYGAGKQSGWWGQSPLIQGLPQSTMYPPSFVGGAPK